MRRRCAGRKSLSVAIALFLSLLVLSIPVVEAVALNLTYDANGNLVTGDGKFRTYNGLNQLVKLYNGTNASGTLLQEYAYHPLEERVLWKKTYNSSGSLIETVVYASDSFNQVVNTSGTYNTTYVFANGQQVAQVLPDGSKQFLLGDIEGSASVTTNATGGVVERTSYTPYGAVLSGGSSTRFDYEGREADAVSGDTDFRFRKYRSEWGLFLQPDDTIENPYDPQQLNRYAFERNAPQKYSDDDGHNLWMVAAGVGILAATWYWITTPITAETDMSDRLITGLEHGAVAFTFTALAPEVSMSGGVARIASPTLASTGRSALASGAATVWDHIIAGTPVTGRELAVSATVGAGSSFISPFTKPGQFAATKSFVTPQSARMLGNAILAGGVGGIVKALINLVSSIIKTNLSGSEPSSSNNGAKSVDNGNGVRSKSSSGGGSRPHIGKCKASGKASCK